MVVCMLHAVTMMCDLYKVLELGILQHPLTVSDSAYTNTCCYQQLITTLLPIHSYTRLLNNYTWQTISSVNATDIHKHRLIKIAVKNINYTHKMPKRRILSFSTCSLEEIYWCFKGTC